LPVKISGAVGILSNAQLTKMDSTVAASANEKLKLNQIINRINVLESQQKSGALPSQITRKNKKLLDKGLAQGRLEDSNQKNKDDKIRATEEDQKTSRIQDFMLAFGLGFVGRHKISDKSLVTGTGPLAGFTKNAFKDMQNEIGRMKQAQTAIAHTVLQSTKLISGASGLGSVQGLATKIFSAAAKFGMPATFILAISKTLYELNKKQYGAGGTRDNRVLIKAGDVSLIGEENENSIFSGAILYLSNPNVLQGLARGPSNTQTLRNDQSRYRQRHEGSYK